MIDRMRGCFERLVVLGMLLTAAGALHAQSNGSAVGEPAPGAVASPVAANVGPASLPATKAPASGGAQNAAATPVLLPATEKKKALELEADRLVAMATELKTRVDKTNKNILSLTVVEQAEEIEHYAHQLKTGDKK